MKLNHSDRISGFIQRHPDSETSLKAWQLNMESNSFQNFAELKRMFGSADYVRPCVVFNISGNKYRLIAVINYELGNVHVQDVLTHAEYDKEKWRQ